MRHTLAYPYDFPFVNLANNYQYLKPLERFKLIIRGHKKVNYFNFFVPYMLQVQVQLIHGCEILATSTTKRIPFSYAPRFNQWLTMKIQEGIPEVLFNKQKKDRERYHVQQDRDVRDWDFIKEHDHQDTMQREEENPEICKVDWDIRYCQLPKKSRLAFNIKAISGKGQERIIASATFLVFDCEGNFQQGKHALKIWPFYKVDQRLGCMKQYRGYPSGDNSKKLVTRIFPELVIQCERFAHKMVWYPRDETLIRKCNLSKNLVDEADKYLLLRMADGETIADMKHLIETDPISTLSANERRKLFVCRQHYMKIPYALPIFLRSVDWLHPLQVNQVMKILKGWEQMTDQEAISLLDAKFAEESVRLYALQLISKMSDDNLALYMLQFSQALMYEDYHYSGLGEMLLERSLSNPYVVGHAFFWSLRANLHMRTSFERYSLLLQQFLMLCGKFKTELKIQFEVNNKLVEVSQEAQTYGDRYKKLKKEAKKNKGEPPMKINQIAQLKLYQIRDSLPALFTLTIEPKIIIRDFDYKSLIVFDSKKKPLRLVGHNEQIGGEQIKVIFKCGDDLRQDILTLQIIELMDKIWLEEGLDLNMTPYRVLGTGDQKGFLEFVGNCKTITAMQKGKRFAAFDDTSIHRFIHQRLYHKFNCNQDLVNEQMGIMRDNFLRSTAGYCVATYILGIGDRHPDNIMINVDNGTLLHIDFGHILGDKKKKFGFERERDPFVLTRQMAFFINEAQRVFVKKKFKKNKTVPQYGSDADQEEDLNFEEGEPSWKTPSFKRFENQCVEGYNLLRRNGARFINLLLIMLSAGIPQLKHERNIQYVKNVLKLNMTEYEAKVDFKKQITKAMRTWSRRFDNFIHNWKHS